MVPAPRLITAVMASQDWDEAAEELVAASVWRLSGRRYTMHPLVRQVALEQTQASRIELERRAALAVTQFVCLRNSQSPPRQDQAAEVKVVLDWVEAELRDLIAAAGFAFAAGEWECALALATSLFDFFQVRGHWANAEQLYTQALEAAAARAAGRGGADAQLPRFDISAAGSLGRIGIGPPPEPGNMARAGRPPR